MKKRNKQYLKEKEYLRLKNALDANYKAQRNLGWVELEEPIHRGYTSYLKLRNDISNREDAWIFEGIIERFGSTHHLKRKNDISLLNNKKNRCNINYYHNPLIRDIKQKDYDYLIPQAQKHFIKRINNNPWQSDTYACIIPNFYFEIKIEKHWVTRQRIFDEILAQEYSEIKYQLEANHYDRFYRWYASAPKSFRKILNKSQRAKAKNILHNIYYKEKEMEFEDNYKSASWLYW